MAGEIIVADLNGNFKEIYADNIADAKPKGLVFQRDIRFVEREKQLGNQFHQPIALTHEHGFSYLPANATVAQLTLNAAVAEVTRDAVVTGTQCVLRSRISYEVAARASRGGKAFRQAMDLVVENMNDSFRKRCEIDFVHGRQGIGTINTYNTVQGVLTISAATFAPGIWAGQENAQLEIWDTTAATATQQGGLYTISQVDIANRQITCTFNTETSVGTGDVVYFRGQRTATAHNVFVGIDQMVKATTGNQLGISVASYSLWAGNNYASTGTQTFGDVNQAIALGVGKGLDEDLVLYTTPDSWVDLLNDEAALRRHNTARSYDVGAEGLTFYSQNGQITIKSSIYVKLGTNYLLAPSLWKRIGATDITFRLPDRGDEFFRHVEDAAAYELRAYSNQAMFTKALAKAIVMTGVTS